MKPLPIRLRVETANGRRQELIFEDVVFLQLADLSRQTSDKALFIIDLNKKVAAESKVGINGNN